MKPKTIAVECACGHSHEIIRPDNEYRLGELCDEWADMLCPNCELNGNDDMDYCDVHDIWFELGGQCWKCDGKR